jgi:hypothetical protein
MSHVSPVTIVNIGYHSTHYENSRCKFQQWVLVNDGFGVAGTVFEGEGVGDTFDKLSAGLVEQFFSWLGVFITVLYRDLSM